MIIKNCPAITICNCKETNGCLLKQIVEVNKPSIMDMKKQQEVELYPTNVYISLWKEHNMAEQTLRLFDIEEGDI